MTDADRKFEVLQYLLHVQQQVIVATIKGVILTAGKRGESVAAIWADATEQDIRAFADGIADEKRRHVFLTTIMTLHAEWVKAANQFAAEALKDSTDTTEH